MVEAIHQLQERARNKREAQRSPSRSRSASGTPAPEPDAALAVAARLLASSPTGSAEDMQDPLAEDSDAEASTSAVHDDLHQPNRFETALLEPLTDDSLALAASVLQSSGSGAAGLPSEAVSPISTSDMDELIQVATLEISPEIYENSTALEVTLGLGDIAATVAMVSETQVHVHGGHVPHTAAVIQTDEEPLSLSLKTSRPEDVELCEALGVTSHQLEVEQELSNNVVDFIRERRASEISL